jgi:hypothetical protein
MTIYHKNKLYGFIILYKTINVKLGIEGEFSNAQMIIYLRRH